MLPILAVATAEGAVYFFHMRKRYKFWYQNADTDEASLVVAFIFWWHCHLVTFWKIVF
jgi:hypothetical protein